ncbi:unnamed protein product [Acanthoscelides obtectus]|uniref:Uncharacterized protein n=1 Tax=Acanthoscelides obtectus TaxID=200917 RepID=A0A9P0PN26_ACAOB|nr:unnamed protein product [Acanthoscelides obtectus]CAK1663165.1 hypothetical protein AOBTE_LOCUS23525 [Acanthoscelides obtectus]
MEENRLSKNSKRQITERSDDVSGVCLASTMSCNVASFGVEAIHPVTDSCCKNIGEYKTKTEDYYTGNW